jgi:arylsulfatase
VQEWSALDADERRAYARMMEVYAGFLAHTDHHIGRLLEFLDASGELDRTVVLLLSDNGASAEGGPHGTFNENFLFNGLPHDLAGTMARLDELGTPTSYGHYPWGWAYAGNTPFKRWKRETHEGGIGDPLIAYLPASLGGGSDAGAIRNQYVHAVDVAATILDACGLDMPANIDGIAQEPIAGASLLPSLRDGDAPEHRTTQYYEQFACRAIYHEGWKAVAFHSMGVVRYTDTPEDDPFRPFDTDRWELYHVAVDPAETHDLAEAEPARLRAMQDLWWREAGRYGALPLHSMRAFAVGRPDAIPHRDRAVYRAGAAAVPEDVAPNVKLRPHHIIAAIDVPDGGADGVLLAQGGRFGGYSLYVQDATPRYTYNFAGIERTTITADAPLASGRHVIGVAFEPTGGPRSLTATATLFVDGKEVGREDLARTTPFRFALAGEGLCCGYDDGTPVADYDAPFAFTGTIHEVVVDVSGETYEDVEAHVAHAWATQ